MGRSGAAIVGYGWVIFTEDGDFTTVVEERREEFLQLVNTEELLKFVSLSKRKNLIILMGT